MTIKGYYFLTPCQLVEALFVTRTIMETSFFNIRLLDDDHVATEFFVTPSHGR